MRYFLMLIGLIGIGVGIWVIAYGPSDSHAGAAAILSSGAVFFAAGAATVDILEALKRNRE